MGFYLPIYHSDEVTILLPDPVWTTNLCKRFFLNTLLHMNGRLSKIHSAHTYVCYTPDGLFWLNLYLFTLVVNNGPISSYIFSIQPRKVCSIIPDSSQNVDTGYLFLPKEYSFNLKYSSSKRNVSAKTITDIFSVLL